MTQKTAAFVVLALLLGAGFLLGSFFGGALIGGYAASSSHRAIVDKIKVVDTRVNLELTPKLVDSGNRKWGEGLTSLGVFIAGKEYPETTWIWQRYGDTDLAMTIWGPDESGTTYDLEFGRLGSCLKVTYNGVEKFTVTSELSNEGFYWFTVTVE